jgi:hypothetical protein|tara:strand:- start:1449 stop:1988 length:540 start_codon:yes stop_codon:yes gene_type:complete
MDYKNTIQALQKLGTNVVKEGRGILKRKKKTTSPNTLFNEFDYLVTNTGETVTLEFVFGKAEDYWQFVDEGVKGVGGFKGSGRARGQGSPFKFSNKMPPRRAIDKWIVTKPLKAGRDERGRFVSRKSLAFLIQRSIFQRGLQRTQFFSRPFTEQLDKQTDNITKAFADDIEIALEQAFK